MLHLRRCAALAAVVLCHSSIAALSKGAGSPTQFYQDPVQRTTLQNSGTTDKSRMPKDTGTLSTPTRRSSSGAPVARSGPAGNIARQIPSVSTACLKPGLVRIIRDASSHFGSAAVITSGFRPGRRSYHGKCMAADVQIAGVHPGTLAKYFRSRPGVGGVGTYTHTRSVHVDVAERRYSWHRGGQRTRVAKI